MIEIQNNLEHSPEPTKMNQSPKTENKKFSKLGLKLAALPTASKRRSRNRAAAVVDIACQIVESFDDSSIEDSTIMSDEEWSSSTGDVPESEVASRLADLLPSKDAVPQPQDRKLRFSDYDDVFEIKHIDEYSREDVDRLWISSKQMNKIRKECRELRDRLDAGGDVDFCTRGLKQHTSFYTAKRDALQRIIQEGVFKVYEYRHSVTIDVDVCISDLYKKMSASSVEAAIETAKSDEIEVYGTSS